MPLRRVTEAAYERHRQKLAASTSGGIAAPAAAVDIASVASAPNSAEVVVVAPPTSAPTAPSAAPAAVTAVPRANAAKTDAAAQQAPPPTANVVAPTPSLFHFECLRCGFSSKQSSKTVRISHPFPASTLGALQYACGARDVCSQVCRRCRWVPPLGSQIRHDAEDASKVNSLAGVATLFCMSSFFAPFYWLSNALSCAQASVRLTRVCSLEPERIAQLRVYQPNNFTASVIR